MGSNTRGTFVCPYCGRRLPCTTRDGKPRRSCSSSFCQGKAWNAASQRWLAGERGRLPLTRAARRCDLPPLAVLAIRESYRPGVTGYRKLAKAHEVSVSTVRRIVTGKTYRYLLGLEDR